jgi:hypothetical protein
MRSLAEDATNALQACEVELTLRHYLPAKYLYLPKKRRV